ncbi:hypothetical protein CBS63078_6698 [Aspergillus niger]|uniref:FAD binding domain family protein n=1 Tax=Aspergillus niger TaxID=5061 RepID=A0A254U9V6_ASPNG|nr:hypothetical protein CBS115989_1381 [Aspergillus niger]KAI2830339.1 hypothetical protein CBS133816_3642 [Aspergillus niger]KAI2857670.1 hypothetical protein CBS11232_3042 [Aspergillus niger]KAI2877882.1 hypothetical protein CBS115988_3540 [Aspergillus niger]KAI2889724.1 hypothetical protein CBS13152_5834 [Aspergillus niger]
MECGEEFIDPSLLCHSTLDGHDLDSRHFNLSNPQPYDLNLQQVPAVLPNAQQRAVPSELFEDATTNNTTAPRGQLPRRRSRYLTRHSGTQAYSVMIPKASSFSPMERWRNSPPEEEGCLIPDIIDALRDNPSQGVQTNLQNPGDDYSAFHGYRRAASITSGESSASSRSTQKSGRSSSSAQNPLAVQGRHGNIRAGKTTRRKTKITSTTAQRRYCCTFCCDRFKSKYDWARHEKSLHVTLEAWHCAPYGTTIMSSNEPSMTRCAFCGLTNPDSDHLEEHAATACEDESSSRRSFRRKDHLVQHLRLVHNVDSPPQLDSWRIGQSAITSRCGFCSQALMTWKERVDHLAEHFRTGSTMAEWRGDHDFPPDFAALVANALPPYLIGSESQSMIPFSATNCDVEDHLAQIYSRANWDAKDQKEASTITAPSAPSVALPLRALAPGVAPERLSSFTQVLTLHLSRFAQEQMKKGVIPSDEMFQQESRRVLYDSDDSWNQTIADNPEWLATFKDLHFDKEKGVHDSGENFAS